LAPQTIAALVTSGLPIALGTPIAVIGDGEADAVTAFDVIEHVAEDAEFLLHLVRVARRHVFLTTPNWHVSRAANPCHVREYTPAQLEALCASTRAGLRYWVGDPNGDAVREVGREAFLGSREPHLGVLLDVAECVDFRRLGGSSEPALEALFRRAVSTPSDINEHCVRLRELASECGHVTEFGMRPEASTVALLAGGPGTLVSYDRRRHPLVDLLEVVARPGGFRFEEGDSLTAEIEETDLLFLDTVHTARQLSRELARHAGRVRRRIVLHDTVTFGQVGEDGGPGMCAALQRCSGF
jgi:hypothetical protein